MATKKKSDYRVSLAMLRPMNYETRVKARSEREAFALALKAWDEHAGWVDDNVYVGDDLLNLDGDTARSAEPSDFAGIPIGAYIEKV